MKPFYIAIIIIGILSIIIGGRGIYVGQDTIQNAESRASNSYTLGRLNELNKEMLTGQYKKRTESQEAYERKETVQMIEQSYKNTGFNQITFGVTLSIFGLLMVLFGRGKLKEIKLRTSQQNKDM